MLCGGPARALALLGLAALCPQLAAGGAEAARGVGPVRKVIQMLTDMSATAKKENNEEEVAFSAFTTWCTQETVDLSNQISKNTEQIETLEAEVGKLESDIEALGTGIAKLQNDVATYGANKKGETLQRGKDREAFLDESKDYAESVDALERAIVVLQKQSYDRTGAEAALLQVAAQERLPERERKVVQAFISMMTGSTGKEEPDFMSYDAPEANAYEFQSGNIIALLKKLKDDFRSKLSQCQKEEMNSKHAYDMIVQDISDSIENSEKEIQDKTAVKERKEQKAAVDKKHLEATITMKNENGKTLAATQTECREKKLSFQEKQNLRTEEIQAMEKAIEILSSPEVLGHAEKHLGLAQSKLATAFVQLAGQSSAAEHGPHRRLRDFLVTEGRRLRSQRLGLLAQKLAANPFTKVKALIESLITRLLEEANQDAQHEGFCNTEMGKSKITRTRLSEEIDGLTAAVDEGKATIARLGQTVAELMQEVAELTKSMAEATTLRANEKATNAATTEDAQQAQKAVQAATAVLKEFYAKALTATALVQASPERRWGLKMGVKMGSEEWNSLANPSFEGKVDTGHKEGMQTFGAGYTGQQDEAQFGVMALLEVIQSDFANLEASTQAAEVQSQQSFAQFMAESKKNKATKERQIEMNNADKASAESRLQEDTADTKATQDQLLAAERYHDKLVPTCVNQGMTFEARTKARAEEIASLKKALEILSSEDVATSAL